MIEHKWKYLHFRKCSRCSIAFRSFPVALYCSLPVSPSPFPIQVHWFHSYQKYYPSLNTKCFIIFPSLFICCSLSLKLISGEWRDREKTKTTPSCGCNGSKVRCCKEQYCIGTWNVRSMNQGKLEVVKQEMARVNVNILGINKLKQTGMGEFNSDCYSWTV